MTLAVPAQLLVAVPILVIGGIAVFIWLLVQCLEEVMLHGTNITGIDR